MSKEELLQVLAKGQDVGFVLYKVDFTPEISFKRLIILSMPVLDPPNRYSWHYLQENPSYVCQQKIIHSKPFLICLIGVALIPEAADLTSVYFSDLEEIDVFLQQFDRGISDFHILLDSDYSL